MGAPLLFGCTGVEEAATQSPDTTVSSNDPETTAERKEIRIEAPDYDPQAVQPEDWQRLSEAQVRKAVNIGLADPRLEDFLRQNDFGVSEVMRTESMHYRLEKSGYTGAICAVGGATGPVAGMVWIVDLVDRDVAAFSPQWNYDVSCT